MHFGGAGVKIGKACLEQYAKEHGIGADGFFVDEEATRSMTNVNPHIHFRENSLGQWTPRSLFFDLESEEIDRLLTSEIGQLVEAGQWVSGNEAAST